MAHPPSKTQGRKILSSILDNSRAIIRDVYSFLLRPESAATVPNAPDDEAVLAISDDLRRRLDILFAFIRQSVRECESRVVGCWTGVLVWLGP